MRVLGLDTTGGYCSAALCDEAKVLAYKSENIGRGHAERLAPMVAEILAEANLAAKDVDKIAVCTGPGSFTGLRVALAFAKGFALPCKLSVVGIDALGVNYFMHQPEGLSYTVVFRDIRRNEIMFGTYSGEKPLFAYHPTVGSMKDVQAEAKSLQLDIIEAVHVDTRILAWLAIDANPRNYPASPLYSRGPDAKLPGGIDPK
jgi:tRNA threonylcarbamoyl adenosine modification protein YeaZ